jgi:hypothetical protein
MFVQVGEGEGHTECYHCTNQIYIPILTQLFPKKLLFLK